MNESIQDFEKAKEDWIKQEKIVDGTSISQLSKDQHKWYVDLINAEVEKQWTPVLTGDDLDGIELSAMELDALIEVGLIDVMTEDNGV